MSDYFNMDACKRNYVSSKFDASRLLVVTFCPATLIGERSVAWFTPGS